jgi:hypothetical protein
MAAPNLASLLNKPADDVKRPVALPDGTYYGIIQGHEFIESSQKKTPGVQYNIQVTHPHEDVDMSDYVDEKTGEALDPREKKMKTIFYLSEGALFMFTDFVESLGIETSGRSIGELVPLPTGQPVQMDVIRKPNKDGTGFYNELKKVTGAQAG